MGSGIKNKLFPISPNFFHILINSKVNSIVSVSIVGYLWSIVFHIKKKKIVMV